MGTIGLCCWPNAQFAIYLEGIYIEVGALVLQWVLKSYPSLCGEAPEVPKQLQRRCVKVGGVCPLWPPTPNTQLTICSRARCSPSDKAVTSHWLHHTGSPGTSWNHKKKCKKNTQMCFFGGSKLPELAGTIKKYVFWKKKVSGTPGTAGTSWNYKKIRFLFF